jgi:hypothetical protein
MATDKGLESMIGIFQPAHSTSENASLTSAEELILDARSEIRPAQMVEDKLADLLKDNFQMVSQLRLRNLIANRS